jgi:hypothetical protein
VEVDLISFDAQVGYFHYYFLQEKTADDESILSQQSGCFEQDCASHINIKILNQQLTYQV